jgi:hypothetical protein
VAAAAAEEVEAAARKEAEGPRRVSDHRREDRATMGEEPKPPSISLRVWLSLVSYKRIFLVLP